MPYGVSEDQDYPRMTAAVQALIAISVAVAFLQLTIIDAGWVQLTFGFQSSDFLTGQFWSLATYMLVHGGLLHLALNMYMLWVFGPRLEHAWGSGSFVRLYLWCGVGGIIGHLIMGGGGVLIGASAAIMGVMYAYASAWPNEEVFFFGVLPMKVKWLVALFVAMNLVSGIVNMGATGGIAYFAHLGGIAFAWIYVRTPSAGNLERIRHRVSHVTDEPDEPPRAIPRSMPRTRERMSEIDEIVARSNALASRRSATVMPPRKGEATPPLGAEALDNVLDKISERGIDSLTAAERRLLEDMSKELRRGE